VQSSATLWIAAMSSPSFDHFASARQERLGVRHAVDVAVLLNSSPRNGCPTGCSADSSAGFAPLVRWVVTQ
jgi:hypothetical protein